MKKISLILALLYLANFVHAQNGTKCFHAEKENNDQKVSTTVSLEINGQEVKATIVQHTTAYGRDNSATVSMTGKVKGNELVFQTTTNDTTNNEPSSGTKEEIWNLNENRLTISGDQYTLVNCN